MDVVLVHGAWHGAWCWHRLIPELERYGATVYAPDLPIAEPFERSVAEVQAVIERCEQPAVLVGHSMGGALISQAAEAVPDRISRLVYLAAFAPADGQSVNSFGRENIASALRGHVSENEDGLLEVDRKIVPAAFYGDCEEADASDAISRLRPQHPSGFSTRLNLTPENYGRCERQYIECIEDQAVHVALQRQMAIAAGCFHINSMRTSHSPFLSAPAELAGFILTSGPPQPESGSGA